MHFPGNSLKEPLALHPKFNCKNGVLTDMYTYEFERIQAEMRGWGPIGGNRYGTEDYRAIIQARAKNGWRYVGFLPAVQRGTGNVEEIDLIFEKELNS